MSSNAISMVQTMIIRIPAVSKYLKIDRDVQSEASDKPSAASLEGSARYFNFGTSPSPK